MQSIFRYVGAIADSTEPVLITGETGVGKGLIAEAIHRISRRKGELVSVNVAGLDDAMFSDTLFGHRKGAYTGAATDREGMIGKAAGGSLFLAGSLIMAYNVWKTLTADTDTAPVPVAEPA